MSQSNQDVKPRFPSKEWFGVSKNRNMAIGISVSFIFIIVIVILAVSGVFGDLSVDDTKLPEGLSCVEVDGGTAYEVSACDSTTVGAITIPSTYNGKPIVSIGNSAFLDCTELTKINIPNSVTSIGDKAFYGCTGLGDTDITIPTSVTKIGKDAFYNTEKWNDQPTDSMVVVSKWIVGFKGDITKYVFYQEGNVSLFVDTVGVANSAFSMQMGIVTLTTRNSIAYIGKSAFFANSSMKKAILGTNVKHVGGLAFDGCFRMTDVIIEGTGTIIDKNAFFGCTQLANIYFAGTEAQWTANNSDVELPVGATIHYNYVA